VQFPNHTIREQRHTGAAAAHQQALELQAPHNGLGLLHDGRERDLC